MKDIKTEQLNCELCEDDTGLFRAATHRRIKSSARHGDDDYYHFYCDECMDDSCERNHFELIESEPAAKKETYNYKQHTDWDTRVYSISFPCSHCGEKGDDDYTHYSADAHYGHDVLCPGCYEEFVLDGSDISATSEVDIEISFNIETRGGDYYLDGVFICGDYAPHEYPGTITRETTHSCTLEFPNGDIVEIPAPDGDGWKDEIETYDNWVPRYYKDDPVYQSVIKHEGGRIVYDEYRLRIIAENAKILSLTKWTRTVTKAPKEDDHYNWGKQFPLLNGLVK